MKLLEAREREPTVEQTCVLPLWLSLSVLRGYPSFSTLVRVRLQRNVGPSETGNEVHRGLR